MSHPYDIAAIRRQFPAAEKITYLNSGFQTPLSTPVKQAIETFLHEGYESAGPKSVWLERVEATRSKVARFIGVSADEIAFTKNTSESMNIAANALPLGAGDSVLMIEGDHPNNAYAFLNLARKGVKVRFIPMTEVVAADTILPYIDATTRAVSMSQVTFHAGHLFDIESIGGLCAEMGLHFVVDVMQAIGVVPFDARKANATFAGCGTHKGLLVPQGLGLLYWNNANSEFAPAYLSTASLASPPGDLIARADHMGLAPGARRFELGNFNLPAIHALGVAIDFIESIGVADIERHCYELGDYLIDRTRCDRRWPGWTARAPASLSAYLRNCPAGGRVDRLLRHAQRARFPGTGWRPGLARHVQHRRRHRQIDRRHRLAGNHPSKGRIVTSRGESR